MKTEELEERLTDAERVLALHDKRLEKLEEQEIQTPPQAAQALGCSAQLEEVKALLKRQDLSTHSLQIYAQIASFRETISQLPKVLPVRHFHHFEDGFRSFVIGGIVCLLTAAIAAGLSFSLYRENDRLQENNFKYSMLRQAYPDVVHWADSVYYQNPEEAERKIRILESQTSTPPQL